MAEYFIAEGTVIEKGGSFNGQDVVEIEVVSSGDFIRHLVKAKVAKSIDLLPGADKLWVRGDNTGFPLNKEAWGIQILERREYE